METRTTGQEIAFLERLIGHYDELYGKPKRMGVERIPFRNKERKTTNNALKYLTRTLPANDCNPDIAKRVLEMIEKAQELGRYFCFDENEYEKRDQIPYRVTFDTLPLFKGQPYFIWRTERDVEFEIEYGNVRDDQWRDKELGPVCDYNGGRRVNLGGIDMITSLKGAMGAHGIKFIKSEERIKRKYEPPPEGTDTEVTIYCGFDELEGYGCPIYVYFREGRIIRADPPRSMQGLRNTLNREGITLRDVGEIVGKEVNISCDEFMWYFINSNLSEQDKKDIGIENERIAVQEKRGLLSAVQDFLSWSKGQPNTS